MYEIARILVSLRRIPIPKQDRRFTPFNSIAQRSNIPDLVKTLSFIHTESSGAEGEE